MGGGPTAEFKSWVGKVLPEESKWGKMASMADLAKTIQTKLAPTMRAAGSGATSDMEMKAYMFAIPTLSNTENGRALMAKYANRISDRANARAQIVNDIEMSGRLPTPNEINRRMKEEIGGDSFFDKADRAYFGIKPEKNPAASSGGQGTVDKTNPLLRR
jgi:hypothetical protein